MKACWYIPNNLTNVFFITVSIVLVFRKHLGQYGPSSPSTTLELHGYGNCQQICAIDKFSLVGIDDDTDDLCLVVQTSKSGTERFQK